jgi:hypothetical protein
VNELISERRAELTPTTRTSEPEEGSVMSAAPERIEHS